MKDWGFAQSDPSEELAKLHYFSMKKGDVDFVITVREYASPRDPTMLFYAEADKQTNQHIAPYTPCGWGRTLLDALAECMRSVNRFEYHPERKTAGV